jgi:hypothetical protein
MWISPSNTALEFILWQTPFVEEHAMKMDILRAGHYTYNFDHELYFNRDAKKVFSFPFLDDHAEDEVLRCINERTDRSAWTFYFNFPPSQGVKRELESTLSEEVDMHLAGAHSASTPKQIKVTVGSDKAIEAKVHSNVA